ncbi:TOBE domain-containing protein [Neomoorella carbonis]|uniref:TOBE domain-containing protein n=1 Tax=Neomoorella carbonis TaxID=3062783 RepID=UPI0038734AF9
MTILAATRVGGRVVACLRPEEIIIQGVNAAVPMANSLRGRIRHIIPQGGLYRIELDCGLPLVALAGASQLRQGCLQPGGEVLATFPPEAVHLIPA